ncbi:MAG TPA: hypothetical protein VJZ51_04695, partial [Bacilli bacterium]|nr:hypothetical protein [Bacilli bacterium]
TELALLAADYEQVVVAISDAKSIHISLVNQISSAREDLIVIALNLPYDINQYSPTVNNYICIYEYSPIMVNALKRLLNNEYLASGKSSIVLNR